VTPAELLRSVRDAGCRVGLDETGPFVARVRPGATLPPGVLADLKVLRAEVIAWLTCRGCGREADEKRRCWKCGFRPCEACGKGTGSVLIATCFTCGVGAGP
jgi:hypothetical protein